MKIFNKQKNKGSCFINLYSNCLKRNPRYSKGFTLIETMVAVFILTMALVALLGLTSKSLFSSRYARNEITTNYLLQESIDYIRNQRDSIAFFEDNWQGFLTKLGYPSGPCFSSDGCYFDVNSNSLNINYCNTTPTSGTTLRCPFLKYDESATSGSFYNYGTSGVTSNFKRKVFLKLNSEDELLVTVTVEWLNGNLVRKRSLSTSFLNWMP